MRRLGRNRDVKSKLDLGEVSNERKKKSSRKKGQSGILGQGARPLKILSI